MVKFSTQKLVTQNSTHYYKKEGNNTPPTLQKYPLISESKEEKVSEEAEFVSFSSKEK